MWSTIFPLPSDHDTETYVTVLGETGYRQSQVIIVTKDPSQLKFFLSFIYFFSFIFFFNSYNPGPGIEIAILQARKPRLSQAPFPIQANRETCRNLKPGVTSWKVRVVNVLSLVNFPPGWKSPRKLLDNTKFLAKSKQWKEWFVLVCIQR